MFTATARQPRSKGVSAFSSENPADTSDSAPASKASPRDWMHQRRASRRVTWAFGPPIPSVTIPVPCTKATASFPAGTFEESPRASSSAARKAPRVTASAPQGIVSKRTAAKQSARDRARSLVRFNRLSFGS